MLRCFFSLGDIVRVMRALTLKYVFVETASGCFAHTGGYVAIGIPGIDTVVGHL